MDVSQYLEIFIDESAEHLQTLSDCIMELEKEPDNKDVINEIFRAAHSLKGMAGTMGFKRMQHLTHDMENVFQEVRSEKIQVDSQMIDLLFKCLDAIDGYLENINDFISDVNDDYSFIMNEAQKAYNISVVNNEIELNKLNLLDNSIKKRVIKLYFENNNLSLDRIHLQNVNKITQKSGKIQIKNDLYAISAKGKLRIANLKNSPKLDEIVTEILNINEFNDKNIDFYCDCDKIIGSVTIRKRLPGDSLKPAGRNVNKTLKKLFNETAYPIEKRNGDIVVCDDKGIIGIIGLCADDRVKKDCNTENVFIIKLPSED